MKSCAYPRSVARWTASAWLCAGALLGCNAILGIGDPVVDPTDGGAASDGSLTGADGSTLGPDGSAGGPDGGPANGDAAATGDADAAAPCDPAAPFTTVKELKSVNSAYDEGTPRLSEDERTIWFDSERATPNGNRYDLYVATRDKATDDFGPASPIAGTGINTTDFEYTPNVVDQGKTLVFERQNAATNASKLMRATRASTNDPFDAPTEVPDVNASCDYAANPFARGTSADLWFVRACGPVAAKIYYGQLSNGGYPGFGPVTALNAGGFALYQPTLSADQKMIYFSRDLGAGNYDIFVSRKTTGDWSAPVALSTPVNATTANETPGWLSPDACRLYFVSNRGGGTGKQDIWVATRN